MPNRLMGRLGALPRCLVQGALALALLPALAGEGRAQSPGIMSTEFFDLALVSNYTEIWRDSGSRANRDVLILRANPPPGFRTLGDVALSGKAEDYRSGYPETIAIRPKPGFERLIASATGAVHKWSTAGTRATQSMTVYGLSCPTGYAALGGFVQRVTDSGGDPNIACVSTDVLTLGTWSDRSVWDDKGTGARYDISFWNAEYRGAGVPKTLIIPANSLIPSTTHEKPFEQAWVMQLTHTGQNMFTPYPPEKAKSVQPVLTGPTAPLIPEGDLPTIEYKIPFYQVRDPDLTFFQQWLQSPEYTVRRSTRYELVDSRDNTGNCETGEPITFSYTTSVGTETSSSWNVNASATVGVEKTAGFKPLGIGASVNISASITLGGGREWGSAESKSTEISDQVVVPAGTAMALFKLKSEYRIYRKGSTLPMPSATASYSNPTLVPAYYRLPGWSRDNGCPRSDVLVSGPARLDKNRKYHSESGSYHLLWDDRDFAVYTDSGHAVWKFSEAIKPVQSIQSIAVYDDGQIRVWVWETGQARPIAAGRLPPAAVPVDLVSNPNRPKGTALYLTDDGALQVVAPNGRVVWDSTAN